MLDVDAFFCGMYETSDGYGHCIGILRRNKKIYRSQRFNVTKKKNEIEKCQSKCRPCALTIEASRVWKLKIDKNIGIYGVRSVGSLWLGLVCLCLWFQFVRSMPSLLLARLSKIEILFVTHTHTLSFVIYFVSLMYFSSHTVIVHRCLHSAYVEFSVLFCFLFSIPGLSEHFPNIVTIFGNATISNIPRSSFIGVFMFCLPLAVACCKHLLTEFNRANEFHWIDDALNGVMIGHTYIYTHTHIQLIDPGCAT